MKDDREGKTMNKSSSDLSFKHISLKKFKLLSSTILTTNVLMVARGCAKNTKEKSFLSINYFSQKSIIYSKLLIQFTFTPQFWTYQEVTFPT